MSFNLEKIFDPPIGAPEPERLFKPFAEPWLTGPIADHLKNKTITDLTALLTRLSLEKAAQLVAFGAVWLDDRPCLEPQQPLASHLSFRINPPAYGPVYFYEADPGRIIFEDQDLIVYNKESGRPSQGVPHDAHNNVLSALRRLLKHRGDKPNLWLLHRLDADTSGLLMLAKNKEAAGKMGLAFQKSEVQKQYLALGLGKRPSKEIFSIQAAIAKEGRRYVARPNGPGLAAQTDFEVFQSLVWSSKPSRYQVLFKALPLTGRTHQIRLHLALAGWPIIGDSFYGRPEGAGPRLMLASCGLSFTHPRSGRPVNLSLI